MNMKALLLGIGLAISIPTYFYATSQQCESCCKCTSCTCDSCACCGCSESGQNCQCA